MCGATDQQKSLEASQAAFYNQLTQQYASVFQKNQGILDMLTSTFEPILKAGPNQRGFSDEERTNLETEATEGVARGFDKAQQALNQNLAARGGSDFIPTGGDAEMRGSLAATAEEEQAGLKQQITAADYAAGEDRWRYASGVLAGTANMYNPTGYAGAATGAGGAASQTANDIAQADNSVWSSVIGGLSGVGGAAIGAWCPAYGGMILVAKDKRIPVQALRKGMLVLGIDGKLDELIETPMPKVQPCVKISAALYSTQVSEGHTFERVSGGYTIAKDALDDMVWLGDDHECALPVTRVEPLTEKLLCYPIKLKRSHGYNVDGFWSLE